MKLGRGIEQPDQKDYNRDSDLLLRVGDPQTHIYRATDAWVHIEQLTDTNTDMDTCIHSYTHTDTRVC